VFLHSLSPVASSAEHTALLAPPPARRSINEKSTIKIDSHVTKKAGRIAGYLEFPVLLCTLSMAIKTMHTGHEPRSSFDHLYILLGVPATTDSVVFKTELNKLLDI